MIVAKSSLLDLDSSKMQAVRFFELALEDQSVAIAAVQGDQASQLDLAKIRTVPKGT